MAEFERYEVAIRKEYEHVPENAFATGRAAILRKFLERPAIYFTEFFQLKYEVVSRENLRRSLRRFSGT